MSKQLTDKEIAYIAGFIDGYGSIYANIVPAKDRRFKYTIRVELSLTQKSTRRWFLLKWQKKLGGNFNPAENSNNRTVDVLTLNSMHRVREVLVLIQNDLMLKRGQAKNAILLIDQYYKKKNMTLDQFCDCLELVDKIKAQNDSEKQKNSRIGASVMKELREI